MSSRPWIVASALLAAAAAEPAWAQTRTVTITEADCSRLVEHRPDPGVAYQAGRDVYGRAVAPADLGGGVRIDLPETYSFELEIQPVGFAERRRIANARATLAEAEATGALPPEEIARRSALLDRDEALIDRRGFNETTMMVGTVTVDLDGRVTFNGAPLLSEEAAALAALCQRRLSAAP